MIDRDDGLPAQEDCQRPSQVGQALCQVDYSFVLLFGLLRPRLLLHSLPVAKSSRPRVKHQVSFALGVTIGGVTGVIEHERSVGFQLLASVCLVIFLVIICFLGH